MNIVGLDSVLDQNFERNAHFLFHVARRVDVAGNAEHLGAAVPFAAEAGEPIGAAAQDFRRHGDRLDIVDRRRATIEAGGGGERRL